MAITLEAIARAVVPEITGGVGAALPAIAGLAAQGTPFAGTRIAARTLGGVAPTMPKLSANEIIRQVRSMGFRVRRQNALKVISGIREQQDAMTYIAGLSPNQRPRMARVPLATDRQRLKYQVKIAVTGRNRFTGEEQTQMITLNSPRLISRNEAYAAAGDAATTEQAYAFEAITGFEMISYTINNPLRPST